MPIHIDHYRLRHVGASVVAACLVAAYSSAQTARQIRGAAAIEPLLNEPPAKIVIDPPLAEPLSRGRVVIQYRTENIEKPALAKPLNDATLRGYAVLQKIFFAPTQSSQAAGQAFIERLAQRKDDLEPASGPGVAKAQNSLVSRMGAVSRTLVSRI